MGMFDSLFGAAPGEWQTKAFGCSLRRYSVGGVINEHVDGDLRDYQVRVYGGPHNHSEDSFATVRGRRLVSVPSDRDASLALIDYAGGIEQMGDTKMTEYTPTIDYLRETWVLDQMEDSMVRRADAEASFDRALAAHDAEVAANAWDQGYNAARSNASNHPSLVVQVNPFRDNEELIRKLGNSQEDFRG